MRVRTLAIFFSAIAFVITGYFGYLAALVDLDHRALVQQAEADSDLQKLQQELVRAKSIADARRRAYERRQEQFISQQKELEEDLIKRKVEEETLLAQQAEQEQIRLVQEQIKSIENQLEKTKTVDQVSLQQDQQDLTFFDDQVQVVEQLVQRQELEEKFEQEASRQILLPVSDALKQDEARARLISQNTDISSRWERLRQLLDKQKELLESRKKAEDIKSYWSRNSAPLPADIIITVNDKTGAQRQLDADHASQIATALRIMPTGFDQRIQRIYLVYGDEKMRRGMSGVGVVFMKAEEVDFFRVLVHEFGHIWDLHREVAQGEKSQFFDGQYRIPDEDPSVTFYKYSWKNNFEKVQDSLAFASGYGSSDPFEDFAESFALYVLQNKTFQTWQQTQGIMAKKYGFLKTIFGKDFVADNVYSARPYDVTQLTVDYELLLGDK